MKLMRAFLSRHLRSVWPGRAKTYLAHGLLLLVASSPCMAEPVYSLDDLVVALLQQNPALRVSQAQEDAASAAVKTATAFINPEIEAGAGPSQYRSGSSKVRDNWGVGISQPLEFGDVRSARRALAESGVRAAGADSVLVKTELISRLKLAYYLLLHRQAILKLAEEDRNLLAEIRDKVKLRAEIGESPRYELIKAETELLAAERDYGTAVVRVTESKALLRGLVGTNLPAQFQVSGEIPADVQLAPVDTLQLKITESPLIQRGKVANESAEARLKLEEQLRNPGLTLKAGVEQDPDLTNVRIGLAIPLPIWNQRQGQIAEAAAGLRQTQALMSERELMLQREIETGYQRYQIARQQVATFESGLLSQAQAVLKVAESAYRFGERGILDYLDAQRTYRAVRKDYLAARYEVVNTALEIERLLGTELVEVKP